MVLHHCTWYSFSVCSVCFVGLYVLFSSQQKRWHNIVKHVVMCRISCSARTLIFMSVILDLLRQSKQHRHINSCLSTFAIFFAFWLHSNFFNYIPIFIQIYHNHIVTSPIYCERASLRALLWLHKWMWVSMWVCEFSTQEPCILLTVPTAFVFVCENWIWVIALPFGK